MDELIKDIESGRIAPLYYICGEHYPLERAARAIRKAVVGDDPNAFNCESLQADTAGADSILSAARTLPMLGPMRLVQVRDMHQLDAKDLAKLLPYVKEPAPTTCLLMLADKADLRLKFFSELKKTGVVVKFEPLKERQVPAWLSTEARRQKIKLKPGAAERIADAVGTDMGRLASALEQLSLYVGPTKPVSPDDVEALLAQTRQRSIFELTNAVGRGQRREALLVLRRMLQDREPGVRIVVMLARHLRQLWSTKELCTRGQPAKAIASQVGIHPYFVKDMIRQSERFSRSLLWRMHRALFEADRRLKSSRLSDAVILEQLVMKLCPPATGR
jgi:DNA polymerase-3 subunit delta